jgi:hypothetical protein
VREIGLPIRESLRVRCGSVRCPAACVVSLPAVFSKPARAREGFLRGPLGVAGRIRRAERMRDEPQGLLWVTARYRHSLDGRCESGDGAKSLVAFAVDKILPLIGAGQG